MLRPHLFIQSMRYLIPRVFAPVVMLLTLSAMPPGASAEKPVNLDEMVRQSPVGAVLPDYPLQIDLTLAARKINTWQAGDVTMLLLDGDTRVNVGAYGFKAKRAVIALQPMDSTRPNARKVAIYLDELTEWAGHGGIQQSAPRLLVTAALSGKVILKTDLLEREAAGSDRLVAAAKRRFAQYNQRIAQGTIDRADGQAIDFGLKAKPTADQTTADPVIDRQDRRQQAARISFAADEVNYTPGKDGAEGTVTLIGNIHVLYEDRGADQKLSLTADKAVIFLAPDAEGGATQQLNAGDVRGVYLEDDVAATNGDYTLRAPRVFYDFAAERAVVMEAVFYLWDVERQVPIYVRAKKLRQVAQQQFRMEEARISTSEFFEPHFSIGVSKMTVTMEQGEDEQRNYFVDAENTTINVGDVPIFWWPRVAGPIGETTTLRSLNLSYNSTNGLGVETEWDLFALLGQQKPEGVDISLLIDGWTSRGIGGGVEGDYDVEKAYGDFIAYAMYDTEPDSPSGSGRTDPDEDDEFRGRVRWQHRHFLPQDWELTLQLGFLSDPLFLEEFDRADALAGLEYESSIYAKKQDGTEAFSFLVAAHLQDFTTTYARLQTPGYNVDKFPEVQYRRIGDSIFGDRVTWFSENRATAMRLSLPDVSPSDLGFTDAASMSLFGIGSGTEFDDALIGMGYDEDTVIRLDTRQELQMPFTAGPVNIVPYAVGRITAYDDDFNEFAGEDDQIRFWGAVGVRLHATFAAVYDDVEMALFDVHRIRHIIEPRIDISYAETTIDQMDLPVYDRDVESINQGGTIRVGMRNTLQTQRGGEGRWYSVDWIRLDFDFVFNTSDVDQESVISKYFGYRPEYSLGGDHFFAEFAMLVTDTVTLVANANYSFETDEIENWNFGFTIDHNPRLTSFVQVRSIEALDTTIIRYGADMVLTPKYFVGVAHSFDLEDNDTRDVTFSLVRRFPRWFFVSALTIDDVSDEVTVGFAIVPEGFRSRIGSGVGGSYEAIERLRNSTAY